MDLEKNPSGFLLSLFFLFSPQEKTNHPTPRVTAEEQTAPVLAPKPAGARYGALTLVRSRAPVSARFFSMSLSQWILIFSRMSSRPLPMGTSSSSSWDPASCLYNTFTSLNRNDRHK